MKKIIRFFDRFEDKVRAKLSRLPILYSFLGAVSIVLFWRAVWALADQIHLSYGWSLLVSMIVLMATGLFVSFFVGDAILVSGIKREKKLIEKTEDEVDREANVLKNVQGELSRDEIILSDMRKELNEIKSILANLNNQK
jgi:hypothetical protein